MLYVLFSNVPKKYMEEKPQITLLLWGFLEDYFLLFKSFKAKRDAAFFLDFVPKNDKILFGLRR